MTAIARRQCSHRGCIRTTANLGGVCCVCLGVPPNTLHNIRVGNIVHKPVAAKRMQQLTHEELAAMIDPSAACKVAKGASQTPAAIRRGVEIKRGRRTGAAAS